MYIHVPKEKKMNLEPSGKKGTFIGYCDTSKDDIIYIPRQRYIDIIKHVTFDEEATFRKSRESHMDEDRDEKETPKDALMIDSTVEEHIPKDHNEIVEPKIPIDPPTNVTATEKRPAWLQNTLQEAEKHATLSGSFRERKKPCNFSSYVALMSKIIDLEPSSSKKFAKKQVWKDVTDGCCICTKSTLKTLN
jgi:hypothetical protein